MNSPLDKINGQESPIEGMSAKKFAELRQAGKIVKKPSVKDGQCIFNNGRIHLVDEKGTHRNLTPRVRMSKKQRRKMRKEAFAAESKD